MHTGRVKWFNNAKGYGFIESLSDGTPDIFVHYSSIEGRGFKTLKQGQPVTFTLADGPKGPAAHNVEALADPPIAIPDAG